MAGTQKLGTGRSSEFLDSAPTFVFTSPGDLTTTDNALISWQPGRNNPVSKATAQVKTAPATTAILIDIKLITRSTGAVVSTLGTVTIPAGALVPASDLTFTKINILDTQALAAEITQVGTGTPGANLTVQVY